jgi:uncharacterized membrane protein YkoI
MGRQMIVVAALAAVVALTAATFAFGGPRGLIWDDGHYAKPGSLDDGQDLLPRTSVPLANAVAAAQQAANGALGQVDLEHFRGGIVFMVDVGNREVRVDATSGKVVAITPRD